MEIKHFNLHDGGRAFSIAIGIMILTFVLIASGTGDPMPALYASKGADHLRIRDSIDDATASGAIFQNGNISVSLISDHKHGELFVKYAKKFPKIDIENFYKSQGMTLIKDYPVIGYHLIRVDESRLGATMVMLSQYDKFEYVEPNYIIKAIGTPNDSRFSELWAMNNTGQIAGTPDADIDATEAWNISTGSKEVIIAVIDTGVDYAHEDLAANMWKNPGEIPGNGIDDDSNGFIDDYYGWDFAYDDNDPMDMHSHGTHVSGTIGGVGNNGKGVAGVSWNVSIMALKVLDDKGSGSTSDAIDAINYATMMGADIMSNSWGQREYSSALEATIQTADNAGILFVAAAGNEASNTDNYSNYPSNYDVPNVMSIAATDRDDNLAYFSNYGELTVDIGAPGVDILSSVPGNGYSSKSGTSMAAPHVSGAAALLKAFNPSLTHHKIKEILMKSADPIPSLDGKTVTGGRLNIYKAITYRTFTPSISFTNPTPANGSTLNQTIAYINSTASNSSTAFIDWNRSLVGWWRFNNESGENPSFFRDWSTWGNKGTCSGVNCPSFKSGKFGKALNFDGINDYVDAGSGESLNITDAITIEAWINPAIPAPIFKGSYDTAGYSWGVAVAENYAYVADGYNGLVIVDVTNPAVPMLKGIYNTPGYSNGVATAGNYSYVADDNNGLVIVNVTNPAAPTLMGSYNTAGNSYGVAVAGNFAYVADSENGLVIVNVTNPAAPTLKGSYDTAGNSYGVAVAGNYAYVADDNNGLVIIDVTDPAVPTLKGSYDTAGYSMGVAVAGNYAYVSDSENGLVIVDATNLAAPTLKGRYDTNGYSYGVAVAGNYAYVADGNGGFVVVDVSDPAAPPLKGSYDTAGYSVGVAIVGNNAYVADWDNGLVIVDMSLSAQEKCWDGASGNYGVISKVSSPANSVNCSWALRYGAPGGGCYLGFDFNGNPQGSRWVTVKQLLTPGQWYHIVGTFNGTDINSYVNGDLKDTNKISAIKGYRNRLLIGNDGWANLFKGKIDEVRIHRRALSPEEIKASYDAGIYRLYRNFTGLESGPYNYQAHAQNLAGAVNQTEKRTLNLITSKGLSLPEALDNTSLIITTGGNANWTGQTAISYFGDDAAKSGLIPDYGTTWMETTISGPGTASFYWKVSSEAGYDFLEFYLDGINQNQISGNVKWQQKSYVLTAGSHTLRWRYAKDRAVIDGYDAGWVDRILFVPT